MRNLEGFVDFDPSKDIPSQEGKVIFITGGYFQSPSQLADNLADISQVLLDWGRPRY